MNHVFKSGLYAITPQCYPDTSRLESAVRLALEGRAAMVQFRDKSGDQAWRHDAAGRLKAICDQFGAPLIVNDDPYLAAAIGAAGVHLGRDDVAVEYARMLLGDEAVIGVSCYDSLERAVAAAAQGADYLAFGSVFPTHTKPGAVSCPHEVFGAARSLRLPLVAIGGITPENGRALIEAGADSLAVISAVFSAPDIRKAAESFSGMWAG